MTFSEYKDYLIEKNRRLAEILGTSEEIRALLQRVEEADIDPQLDLREKQCKGLAEYVKSSGIVEKALNTNAETVAAGDSQESVLAGEVMKQVAIHNDFRDKIFKCQKDCEELMHARLKAVSNAIQSSVKKRKVTAAYGPTGSTNTPRYMDKQG